MSAALPVTLLVQGLKSLGLPERLAPHAALVLSVLAAIAVELVATVPGSEPFVRTVVLAGVLWLVATGIYTVGKNVRQGI